MVVANEFLDALPVRQLVRTERGWRERMVIHQDGRFVPAAGSRPMDAAVPQAMLDSPVGTIWETCPGAGATAFAICERLKAQGGTALFIDYGYVGPRPGSTLQAVRAHRKVDPFANPGLSDLSALVDFAALGQVAELSGVATLGPVDQGPWLLALGIAERAAQLGQAQPDQADGIAGALQRLVAPNQMGSLFKVIAFVAPDWPPGEGFAG
jgi:NADH dehydrogenase [ubiquinone] 1 alpha subcomplex assembly factor 7